MRRLIRHILFLMVTYCAFFYFYPLAVNAAGAYTVVSQCKKSQYDGEVTYYKHDESGAMVVYIKTGDSEKAFTIGFRTPTLDDTGVNHILEHSLLNGATNAPSKPFTWLINHTGATYLNEMTFHDFTVYVLASRDESEYRKLMATYLDRIFYPKATADEGIFRQEGWRPDAGGYNGTVYNEMKGVYSTDDAYMLRAVYASLFPDGAYRYDSGGLPDMIPTLTFDRFKEVYEQNYRPGNALIVLYGRQNIDAALEMLDKSYLSPKSAGVHDKTVREHKP